jgi:hypothetical protein
MEETLDGQPIERAEVSNDVLLDQVKPLESRQVQCIAIPVELITQLLDYLGDQPHKDKRAGKLYELLGKNNVGVTVTANG